MKALTPAILLAALIPSACTFNSDRLTFEAKASDLRRSDNALAKNKLPGDLIAIALPGKLHGAIPINPITRAEADWTTPEHAAATDISAYLSGNLTWILDGILPAERESARAQLSDPATLQLTQDYYRNLGKILITGWAEVSGSKVVFLQADDGDGDGSALTLTVTYTPGGWKQTKALVEDDTFDLVTAAVRTGGVR